jgi:transposase, IS30 family
MNLLSAKIWNSYMNKYHQLSQSERYTINILLQQRESIANIALFLKRSPSTIYRERSRNRSTHDNFYRAECAHEMATARRRRARRGSHFSKSQMRQVIALLKRKWSPEQIVDEILKRGIFTISHETIYKFILKDKKHGGLLYKHLRIMPKVRRKRYNTHDSRGILLGKRHISSRPKYIEKRKVLGHWEGDTVIGSDLHHCILTFVERKSGLVFIKKMKSRTVEEVTRSASAIIKKQPEMFKTITFDNGTEFHYYKVLERRFPIKCYFATQFHSWERGSNVNLNGLIRQYIPKGSCKRKITQAQCNWIARELNSRPRKRHGFLTPQEVYDAH